jgi:hypothetical protein
VDFLGTHFAHMPEARQAELAALLRELQAAFGGPTDPAR